MRIQLVVATLIGSLGLTIGIAHSSSEAQSVNAEPLRITLSKIAPLEHWEVQWFQPGVRVCWRLFRPNPERLGELLRITSSFHGITQWHMVDDCLTPGMGVTSIAPKIEPQMTAKLLSPQSAPVLQLNAANVSDDLSELANQIEARLHLENVAPKPFSKELLSKDGLRGSQAQFEDFAEGGQRITYLITEPGSSEVFEPVKHDKMLHFGPFDNEITAIFNEILAVDLTLGHGRALTPSEQEKIMMVYPVLWKISDYYEDAYLSRQEAELLYRECQALDKEVSSPQAIRGLDKLIRIAHWASEKGYGVLFSAP